MDGRHKEIIAFYTEMSFSLHPERGRFDSAYPATLPIASLHAPCPAAPTAATRNQYFVPLDRPFTDALALVDSPARVHAAVEFAFVVCSIT